MDVTRPTQGILSLQYNSRNTHKTTETFAIEFHSLILPEVQLCWRTMNWGWGGNVDFFLFPASSASQTNHHLPVCGCRVHKAPWKPLVLTKHFVSHSVVCQVLAVDALVALRADMMFAVPMFASEVAGSQAAAGERKKT